jgi:RNA polymerase sigma-70 factor (ECF subfamily)
MNEVGIAGVLPMAEPGNNVERLAILFDGHYDRLYRLARRLTASTDDALDLVQETFVKAARHPKSIPDGHANEEAWLVRVLINIRRDQWRKTSTRNRFEVAGSAETLSVASGEDAERAAIARNVVWRALEVLSPRRRAVVVMHELEEMAVADIASLLGISQITVRWHLSMGRRDLIAALRAYTEKNK